MIIIMNNVDYRAEYGMNDGNCNGDNNEKEKGVNHSDVSSVMTHSTQWQ